ncbi:hypothetical protein EV121DRAFT_288661 [Schizophyllum commune]
MACKSYFIAQADSPWLIMDRTNLIGVVVSGGAWGVLLSLSFLAARALVACRSSTSKATRAHALPLLVYVAVVFSCGTVNYAANIALNVHMFVENRLYHHGPTAYLLEHYDNEFNVLYNASYVAANILVEALLLYRCFVVWSDKKWIVAIPAAIYMASTVMSCLFLYQIIKTSLSQSTALRFAAAYFLVTFSVTPLLTLLIAGRLMAMSKRVKETLGPEHARTYTSIAALVVESAAPYALTYLAFIIAYCLRNAGANVILPILAQNMCTSSMLIILRVASGRAWDAQTTDLALDDQGRPMRNLSKNGRSGLRGRGATSGIYFKSLTASESDV